LNTPSNKVKVKFFALYIGQNYRRILNETVNGMLPADIVNGSVINNISDGKYPESYIELRTVDQLTDEEKQAIADLMQWYPDEVTDWLNGDISHEDFQSPFDLLRATDALRQFGILLPFTYLSEDNKPITLSPSDLIGFGWVKMEKEV
jgi:hypothetical protein